MVLAAPTRSFAMDLVKAEIDHAQLVSRLFKLRDAAWEAVLWGNEKQIVSLAKTFSNIVPTGAALAETGVGHLLADESLWSRGGELAVTFADKAVRD